MRNFPDRRAGQILVFSTLTLFFTFTVMGLAVDFGFSYFKKQQVQAASDAAATAALQYAVNAGSITCGVGTMVCNSKYTCLNPPTTPPTTALMAGCLYAKENGFVNAGNQTVTLIANNTAVPNEAGVSPALWIKASVSETVPHLFLYLAGSHSGAVASQAIAGLTSTTTGSAGSSIYALGTGIVAYTESGSGSVTAAGITVDGDFNFSGSANITTGQLNIVGKLTASGSGNISATNSIRYGGTYSHTGSGSLSPAPVHASVTPVSDPFAGVPAPTVASPPVCDHTSFSISGASATTINPGVYCGGISISGSGAVTFNAGTYVLYGGGMSYSGSGNLSGSNVMIYNTGGGTHPIDKVSMSGSGSMNLSANSTGTYQGILFFGDRTQTYATANTISGSGNISSGTFYFPTTEVDYSGSTTAHYQALVAKVVKMTGSGNLPADLTGALTGFVRTTATASLIQ